MQKNTKSNVSITSKKVQAYVLKLLLSVIKVLPIYQTKFAVKLKLICNAVLLAATKNQTIHSICSTRENTKSSVTIRNWLKLIFMTIEQAEDAVNQMLQDTVKLSFINGKKIVCVDITDIEYYGQAESDPKEIRCGKRKNGTNRFHAYATIYLRVKKQRYTLAMTYVLAGEHTKDVIERLYRRLLLNCPDFQPDLWLLDRGFYNSETISWFIAHDFAFIVPACKLGRKANHPKGPTSTNRYTTWKASGWDKYSLTSHTKHTPAVTFDVAVFYHCGKDTAFIYACWHVRHLSIRQINQLYRSRFCIESTYRQSFQALVRTASRSPVLRLFFFGLAMILRNVWVLLNLDYALKKNQLTFQLLLDWIADVLDSLFSLQLSRSVSKKPKFNTLHT